MTARTAWGFQADAKAGEDWRLSAECRSADPELFFALSDRGVGNLGAIESERVRARVDAAKAVCRRCDVIDECLSWALGVGDSYAILAGTTPQERRELAQPKPRLSNRGKPLQPGCWRGHEFTADNTRLDKRGRRCCRACEQIRNDARSEAREARLSGVAS